MRIIESWMKSSFITTLFLFCWLPQQFATTYYFSTLYGDDSRTAIEAQSNTSPWQSLGMLNQIMNLLEPGDSVLFHRGEIFSGHLVITASGTVDQPIYFGAYGVGDKPIFTGFTEIDTWYFIGDGIFASDPLYMSSAIEVNLLSLDGVAFAKGRYPNPEEGYGGYLIMEDFSGTTLTDAQFTSDQDWRGAQVVIRTSHWTFERRTITQHTAGTIEFSSETEYQPKEGFGYFIQNHPTTLDQYGEWHYDSLTQRVRLFTGGQSWNSELAVKVSTQDILIEPQGNNLVLEDLAVEGANKYGIYFNGYGHRNVSIKSCKVSDSGIDAIHIIGIEDLLIEDCQISNSNNCALKLTGQNPNTILRRNQIMNTGIHAGMGGDADGHYSAVYTDSRGLQMYGNRIINTGYVGIRFADEDVLVERNFVQNFCTILDDGAGIYTYDSRGIRVHDRKVIANIVLDGIGAADGTPATESSAMGIYIEIGRAHV